MFLLASTWREKLSLDNEDFMRDKFWNILTFASSIALSLVSLFIFLLYKIKFFLLSVILEIKKLRDVCVCIAILWIYLFPVWFLGDTVLNVTLPFVLSGFGWNVALASTNVSWLLSTIELEIDRILFEGVTEIVYGRTFDMLD